MKNSRVTLKQAIDLIDKFIANEKIYIQMLDWKESEACLEAKELVLKYNEKV
jgi:hypothetical protein